MLATGQSETRKNSTILYLPENTSLSASRSKAAPSFVIAVLEDRKVMYRLGLGLTRARSNLSLQLAVRGSGMD
jgi:hypothetical protein